MNVDFRPVKAALFAQIAGNGQIAFSAGATAGSAVLTAPTSVAGLFPGLPIFGTGVAEFSSITAIAADGSTITLSDPMMTDTVNGETAFSCGFQTMGTRVQHWNKVADQPAFFLRRVATHDDEQGDGLIRTTLHFEAWIYTNGGQDPVADPDDMLSAVEMLVRNALDPDQHPYDEGEGLFTLKTALAALGLPPVFWCRVSGRSSVSPGDQGPQAIGILSILVTLP